MAQACKVKKSPPTATLVKLPTGGVAKASNGTPKSPQQTISPLSFTPQL